MDRYIRLGVNIDHVATLRNVRAGSFPNIVDAARIVEKSGADLITVHIREDRRHINENDLENILKAVNIPLNLEIAANQEMIEIATKYKPKYICLVPEHRNELTTEGGLDVVNNYNSLFKLIRIILQTEIKLSLFIDPDKAQIKAAKDLGVKTVEFHTGSYANAFTDNNNTKIEIKKLEESILFAKHLGLNSHAGHGLTYQNVSAIAALPYISELNIGHFIIADSIFNGLENSILKMRDIITKASS